MSLVYANCVSETERAAVNWLFMSNLRASISPPRKTRSSAVSGKVGAMMTDVS